MNKFECTLHKKYYKAKSYKYLTEIKKYIEYYVQIFFFSTYKDGPKLKDVIRLSTNLLILLSGKLIRDIV